MEGKKNVCIIGGGLTGMAAAWAASQAGKNAVILERAPCLGGRCTAFYDIPSGQSLNNCPHVFLACCRKFDSFLEQTDLKRFWKRENEMFFFPPPEEKRTDSCRFTEAAWLPGMLRLVPGLLQLTYLTINEKIRLISDLLDLKRRETFDGSFAQWLDLRAINERVRTRFYEPVILSALSCALDKPAYKIARMVFVESFFQKRNAWNFSLPTISFREMFDSILAKKLESLGVRIRRNCGVSQLNIVNKRIESVRITSGEEISADDFVLAVNFPAARRLLPELNVLTPFYQPEAISCVHFWTARPIFSVPHGVFPGRLIQWIFSSEGENSNYYQAVISGSNDWIHRKNEFESVFRNEIAQIAPGVQILRQKTVHWSDAVCVPSLNWLNARQDWFKTTVLPDNLRLCGDWTDSLWPSTMEAAVRSELRAGS